MTVDEDLVPLIRETAKEYPDLRDQLIDYYQMALEEIEDGESEHGEVEKAIQSIEELKSDKHQVR